MKCRIQILRKEVWFSPNMNSGKENGLVCGALGDVSRQTDIHIWLQQKVILVQESMRTCGEVGYRCL